MPQLSSVVLSQSVSLRCSSTYAVADISYSRGTLTLIVDYSEDLEARDCELTVAFPGSVRFPTSALAFFAISDDIPLILSAHLDQYATIETVFGFLGYAALGFFLLSLGHKMIGAELLFCCQMVCLSNYFYRVPSFLFSPVKKLGLVTGWPLFHTS